MNSLDRRRDIRTVDQFAKDIKEATLRERKLIDIWVDHMASQGSDVIYKDNGIDNSGELKHYSDGSADYLVSIDGSDFTPFEIKHNFSGHKMTFKVADLKSYLKQNAWILLFYNISKDIVLTKNSRWAIIDKFGIKDMLALPYTTDDPKWGYKPVVTILAKDFDKFFIPMEFSIKY